VKLRLLAVLSAALLVPACGTASGSRGDATVTVLAAASLTESFTALATAFEEDHPGTKVQFSFAASSTLARQITEGSPGDVFAAASATTMKAVTDAGRAAGEPVVFARNRLEIAVPKGNPGRVRSLADFGRPELRIAICAPQVPCGAAAATVFAAAGVTPAPDTLEQDVKATLAKVVSGEVDAALVYRTDVSGSEVRGIDFPESARAVNDYPIVVLRDAQNAEGGRRFRDFVLSSEGRATLRSMAFETS
jgi:molybdate transport system substrate-binding protein